MTISGLDVATKKNATVDEDQSRPSKSQHMHQHTHQANPAVKMLVKHDEIAEDIRMHSE